MGRECGWKGRWAGTVDQGSVNPGNDCAEPRSLISLGCLQPCCMASGCGSVASAVRQPLSHRSDHWAGSAGTGQRKCYWCFSQEMPSAFCLIVISQEFRWVNLGFILEVNLIFVSQKTLNNAKFQAKKKRPSEENTSDHSGKVHFSELPYSFSLFNIKVFQWFSFLECSNTVLLEIESFSFSFGIDPCLIPMVCIPGFACSPPWRGRAQVCIIPPSQLGFLWREAWSRGCEAVGGAGVGTFLGLEAWSSCCGAELGVPLAAAQAQLSV